MYLIDVIPLIISTISNNLIGIFLSEYFGEAILSSVLQKNYPTNYRFPGLDKFNF